MYWDFASTPASSAIDALLDHVDVTVEQLLDEPDILDETKRNHHQLIAFWAQPRVAARLLEHVLGRAALPVPPDPSPEWQEKAFFRYPYLATEILTADVPALSSALLAHPDTTLAPFFAAGLPSRPVHVASPPPHHSHPLFGKQVHPPVRHTSRTPLFPRPNQPANRQAQTAFPMGPGWNVLLSYWARIISHLLETQRIATSAFLQAQPRLVERLAANAESPAVMDLIYRIIEIDADVAVDEPCGSMIQWFSEHRLIPTLLALLSSVHSRAVHNNVTSLLRSIIERSGPAASAMLHEDLSAESEDDVLPPFSSKTNILVRDLASPEAAEMLVLIMLDELPDEEKAAPATFQPGAADEERVELPLCPMDMPSSEDQLSDYFTFSSVSGPPLLVETPGSLDVRLRGPKGLSSSLIEADESGPPCAPRVTKTPDTVASALVAAVDIAIELIRKNNSDYFEQSLFQYLRQTIMNHQQLLAKRRMAQGGHSLSSSILGPYDARPASPASSVDSDDLSPEEVAEVDEAVRLACDKMAIVNLGPLLRAFSRRLGDLQSIVLSPYGAVGPGPEVFPPEHPGEHTEPASPPTNGARELLPSTVGPVEPLGAARQRMCELYAELLHCSNMALLNRANGSGPEYDGVTGTLLGGINGFQALTDAMNLDHCDLDPDEAEVEEAGATSEEACEPLRRSTDLMPPSPETRTTSLSTDGPSSPRAWEESTVGTTVPPNEPDESKPASYEDIAWDHRLALAARLKHAPVPVPEGLSDGDLLKERFLSLSVPSTLLDLFFIYPWNNLLHNVVYDIVQQCFTARLTVAPAPLDAPSDTQVEQPKTHLASVQEQLPDLSRGLDSSPDSSSEQQHIPEGQYARALALELLGRADLCGLIVRGSAANEASESGPRRIRLGFMGHLNLIAGEAGKVLEKYPLTLGVPLRERWGIGRSSAWDALLHNVQVATDAGCVPLGGTRPTEPEYPDSNSEFDEYGPSQVIGTFNDYDEAEDGAEWAAGVRQIHDKWHSSITSGTATGATGHPLSDPLAAPDWDAEFQAQTREQDERNAARGYDLASSSDDEDESSEESLSSSSESDSDSDDAGENDEDEYDPFVDLLDPRSRAGLLSSFRPRPASPEPPASPRQRARGGAESAAGPAGETGASPILIPRRPRDAHEHRRRSSAASSSGSSLELVAVPHSPLGPGVDPESTVDDHGALVRTFDMGLEHTRIQVPLDDVALALSEAQHMALS